MKNENSKQKKNSNKIIVKQKTKTASFFTIPSSSQFFFILPSIFTHYSFQFSPFLSLLVISANFSGFRVSKEIFTELRPSETRLLS